MVVAALFFGGAAWPLFDDAWLKRHLGGGRLLFPSYVVVVVLLGMASIYSSGAIRIFFEPQDATVRMRQAGRVIDVITDDNDLAIVVDDYGIMSPILLIFCPPQGMELRTDGHLSGRDRQPAPAGGALLHHHTLAGIEERKARGGSLSRELPGSFDHRRARRHTTRRSETEEMSTVRSSLLFADEAPAATPSPSC